MSRVDAWGEKEEGPTKNNIATDGGGWTEQCLVELLGQARRAASDRHQWKNNV